MCWLESHDFLASQEFAERASFCISVPQLSIDTHFCVLSALAVWNGIEACFIAICHLIRKQAKQVFLTSETVTPYNNESYL